jgi:hypothetical protein
VSISTEYDTVNLSDVMRNGTVGRAMAGDTRSYTAMATWVTLAQVANAGLQAKMKLRGSVLVGEAGESIGALIMGGKKPPQLPR